MASRLLRSTRSTIRVGRSKLTHATQSSSHVKVHVTRRGMASDAHAHETKSDTTWIIGSVLLFGPALVYLLGPARKSTTGHGDPHEDPHPSKHGAAPAPVMQKVKQDEEADSTEEQQGESEDKSEGDRGTDNSLGPEANDEHNAANSPKDDGGSSSQDDDDAQNPSKDEVKDAVQKSIKSDAPKAAQVDNEKQ